MDLAVTPARDKRIAIVQSAYIPWKGFFDLVGRCDEYVILDGAQFVKRHWHNRNQIKTASGVHWLTSTGSRLNMPIVVHHISRRMQSACAFSMSRWSASDC